MSSRARLDSSCIDGPRTCGRFVPVAAEEVGDRVLGESEAVVHAEAVGRSALGVVEVDLVGDSRQQRMQACSEVGAGIYDALALRCLERVPGRSGHVPAWYAAESSVSASGS